MADTKPAARANAVRRDSIDGPERRCSRCHEWWPEDIEFYNRHARSTWQCWCKACSAEVRATRRKAARAGAGASA